MLIPLKRRTICAFDKGKRWDRDPVLEVPDLEDQVHVEETEEDEQEDEQACHLVGVLVFDWRHLSIRSWSEEQEGLLGEPQKKINEDLVN